MRFLLAAFIILNSALGFGQAAVFSVDKRVYKFPKTEEGPKVVHEFVVTNSGTAPLIISGYTTACNCTFVDLPGPIAPGASGKVVVTFDTKGKYYQQDRSVMLSTNGKKEMEQLRFKIFVVPKKEDKK